MHTPAAIPPFGRIHLSVSEKLAAQTPPLTPCTDPHFTTEDGSGASEADAEHRTSIGSRLSVTSGRASLAPGRGSLAGGTSIMDLLHGSGLRNRVDQRDPDDVVRRHSIGLALAEAVADDETGGLIRNLLQDDMSSDEEAEPEEREAEDGGQNATTAPAVSEEAAISQIRTQITGSTSRSRHSLFQLVISLHPPVQDLVSLPPSTMPVTLCFMAGCRRAGWREGHRGRRTRDPRRGDREHRLATAASGGARRRGRGRGRG